MVFAAWPVLADNFEWSMPIRHGRKQLTSHAVSSLLLLGCYGPRSLLLLTLPHHDDVRDSATGPLPSARHGPHRTGSTAVPTRTILMKAMNLAPTVTVGQQQVILLAFVR